MRRRFFSIVVAISALHYIVRFASNVAVTQLAIDGPRNRSGVAYGIAEAMFQVLSWPGSHLLPAVMIDPSPYWWESLVMLGNNILWGVLLALIVASVTQRRSRHAAF